MAEPKTKTKTGDKKIVISFYPDEFEKVEEEVEVKGEILNSRDVREYFGLNATHRQTGAKGLIRENIKDLDEEQLKEILEKTKEMKGKE